MYSIINTIKINFIYLSFSNLLETIQVEISSNDYTNAWDQWSSLGQLWSLGSNVRYYTSELHHCRRTINKMTGKKWSGKISCVEYSENFQYRNCNKTNWFKMPGASVLLAEIYCRVQCLFIYYMFIHCFICIQRHYFLLEVLVYSMVLCSLFITSSIFPKFLFGTDFIITF